MPTRPLNHDDNIGTIKIWLDENLNDQASLVPHQESIELVPKKKGIYCWFMHPDGYKVLSQFVEINAIIPKYERSINGIVYDLVYSGTAGTGKNGNSNLQERLKWHINQQHTKAAICHGTLSTLRAGLGALLSDDLILPNTEQLVNDFMQKYLIVYWIAYDEKQITNIDNDEKKLIKTLKPLLNIRNNPNAVANASENPTKRYRVRRNVVYLQTRIRLNCGIIEGSELGSESGKNKPNVAAPSYQHQVFSDENECVEFSVSQNQSIHAVINGIEGLPEGHCKILITSLAPGLRLVYINGKVRKTGSGKQNIYSYFLAPDTNHDNIARWRIIQNEMKAHKIEEIIVRICTNSNVIIQQTENEILLLDSGKNKFHSQPERKPILLIPCSGRKLPGGTDVSTLNNLSFDAILRPCRIKLLEMYYAAGNGPLDWDHCLPAYQRYNGLIYTHDVKKVIAQNANDILIVSALFGIIKPTDLIPDYNLSMEDVLGGHKVYDFWRNDFEECKSCILNSVLYSIKKDKPEVIFIHLLSQNYQKAFCNFTRNQNPPALNYVPGLIQPPVIILPIDKWGYWKRNYLKYNL